MSDPTGGGDTQGDETALLICRSLNGLRWPNGGIGTERSFNRACLTEIFHLTPGLEPMQWGQIFVFDKSLTTPITAPQANHKMSLAFYRS